MTISNDKKKLRQDYRKARNSLTQAFQTQSANTLVTTIKQHRVFEFAEHIALYLAQDGELSCEHLIDWCWAANKKVHLPVINPDNTGSLLFCEYRPDTQMKENQFGIPEPDLRFCSAFPIGTLDIICMPLVAFDLQGNRLGMGGGYYDRTFAQNGRHATDSTPRLFGLAHDCQMCEKLITENWDIPLAKIITPTQFITANNP